MKCSLCGHVFQLHSAENVCKACSQKKECILARCPNCGFENVAESFSENPREKIFPLIQLLPHEKGLVSRVHTKDRAKLQKLIALGALPGTAITLVQKFPSYVFQMGYSRFTVDRELAECIFVEKGQ